MPKLRWGILSTSKFAFEKIVPAMRNCEHATVTAVASRDIERARQSANQSQIGKVFDSYEALLEDADIDVVYNPLPNHLHVPLSISALRAGKHVLCEKPIAMTAAEAQVLLDESKQYPKLKVMEAFMYRFHPQWQRTKQIIRDGRIGELRTVQSFFSYFNNDRCEHPESRRDWRWRDARHWLLLYVALAVSIRKRARSKLTASLSVIRYSGPIDWRQAFSSSRKGRLCLRARRRWRLFSG